MHRGLVQSEPAVSFSVFSFLQIANLASLNRAVRCLQNQGLHDKKFLPDNCLTNNGTAFSACDFSFQIHKGKPEIDYKLESKTMYPARIWCAPTSFSRSRVKLKYTCRHCSDYFF